MELKDVFKRLGHPKHAERVYDYLVHTKSAQSVTQIATATKLPRMTVYRCLDSLETSNLVASEIHGKRQFYYATNPQRLAEAMQFVVTSSTALATKLAPANAQETPRTVRFLYGKAGITEAFDDVVAHTTKGETFFRYTSEQDLAKVNAYLAKDYRVRRDKKKLERMVISNAVSGSQKRSRLERFIRFIPAEADQFQQNIIQLVYGKRVSIIDLETETVTIIENERLAEFQKVIFKLLYKRL